MTKNITFNQKGFENLDREMIIRSLCRTFISEIPIDILEELFNIEENNPFSLIGEMKLNNTVGCPQIVKERLNYLRSKKLIEFVANIS